MLLLFPASTSARFSTKLSINSHCLVGVSIEDSDFRNQLGAAVSHSGISGWRLLIGPDDGSAKTELAVHQPLLAAPIDTGAVNSVALFVFDTRQPLHQRIKRLLFHCDAYTTV